MSNLGEGMNFVAHQSKTVHISDCIHLLVACLRLGI
jgi:hypothetical protein